MASSQSAYMLFGLTALVAALVAVLVFAVLRFSSAARDMRRRVREGDSERAFVAMALEDAIRKLREQERAMTLRAESSERLSDQIVTSLASGLLVAGLDGSVRMLNPAGRRLLRLPPGENDESMREVLAEAPGLIHAIEECLASASHVLRRSITVNRSNGGDMHLGVTVSPLLDANGSAQGAICLFSDLTAVVDLEAQIRLKDSLARLGELTAGLAHEFRNGLATIHGYARLMDPGRVSSDYAPYVQAIRDETETLGRVVTNFLGFAKPVQLTLMPVDVGEIVRAVTGDLRAEVAARGGSIEVRGEFATVDGDEILLRQAFGNLLRNAIEASLPGGVAPRVVVEGSIVQDTLRVTVTDNGPGIEEALRERIFRPFFTTKSHGTGLGLALVQKIIVTHNGRIAAHSADDGGACFQVQLPLQRPA